VTSPTPDEGPVTLREIQQRAFVEAQRRWDLGTAGREASQNSWHWFGSGEGGVVAGLVELLDRHLRRPRGRFQPAAIGCVPWFNHPDVAARLAAMASCIVINKPRPRAQISPAARGLHQNGYPIQSEWFAELHDLAPVKANGGRRVVGPSDRIGSSIGPLRVYGHQHGGGPILHAKLLVLGGAYEVDDEFVGEIFIPDLVWVGSANWTIEAASLHSEPAVAVADPSFVRDATKFLLSVIAGSESINRYAPRPKPDLAPVDLDNSAFADYAAEFGPDAP
jgi:hypothetical protein